ncbi:MAG: molybdopterin molybdenumtransferase MoeA [Desulfobacteraceae bacterium 4572_35.1]|nr:MAG: molybdopterin molybdenumtransferase MoeA [Desulfobacteraceae bacterium 4572_35.1]
MISLKKALDIILKHTPLMPQEMVGILDIVNSVSAEDVSAPWDMPRWDNSEMDGFAINRVDCKIGSHLKVVDYLPAGKPADNVKVAPGTAVRIMTGAPIPNGCSAVVPIENTEYDGGYVTIKEKVQAGDYIRTQGSDIAAGDVLITSGTVLRPGEVNLLAAFNKNELLVYARPKVAILSTGDELVALGETAGSGKIIDSNAYSLAAAVKQLGASPYLLGIAKDNLESLTAKIMQGLGADILITSAGVSAGDKDLVCEALKNVGVEQLFWRVAMKPAGPTSFGVRGRTLFFSVPGNPVSSMIGFEELVRPALLKMMGHHTLFKTLYTATAKSKFVNYTGKVRFLRVKVTETPNGLVAESAGNQNTGVLSTMIRANAYIIVAAEQNVIECGEQVRVRFL